MDFKGIKNKWENNNDEVIRAYFLGASYKICDVVKDMPYPANEKMGIAHAKLITAAPELLEAAKMAYVAIRHETNPSNSQLDAYFKLEKAINKALGENI
tara:strand:- start:90 stop:386 length:297 start_codon:yes stop_codon:yes gene_type:complete